MRLLGILLALLLQVALAHADGGSAVDGAWSDSRRNTAPEASPSADRAPHSLPSSALVVEQEAAASPKPISLTQLKKLDVPTSWLDRLMSLFGLAALLGIAFALSNNRKRISWRLVAWGLGLQMLFGVLVMKTALGESFFSLVKGLFVAILGFTEAGSTFLFGNLATMSNVPVGPAADPFAPIQASGNWAHVGATFAFGVLPVIIFFASLTTVLYHLGLMQRLVGSVAWLMQKTMGTSGAESLSAAGNIFLGQTEAPLLIKPYIEGMTRSELMAVMTGGFATVAGSVLAAYVGMLVGFFPDIAGHLLSASVMSAPAALVCAKLMWPESEQSQTQGSVQLVLDKTDANVIDAAARGAGDGLKLALNIGAMLLAFIALVAMINALLGLPADWYNARVWQQAVVALQQAGLAIPQGCGEVEGLALKQCIEQAVAAGLPAADFSGWTPLSLERLLGYVLAPVAWLMGVPWEDAPLVASLFGVKTMLNEFVAYQQLAAMLANGSLQHPRSVIIATYALCGFANFSSIAIQIGGIGGMAPSRRQDLARLGLRAMVGGTLAAFMTATVAGMLV